MARRKRSRNKTLAAQLADANRRAKANLDRAERLQGEVDGMRPELKQLRGLCDILQCRNGDLSEYIHELKARERYRKESNP